MPGNVNFLKPGWTLRNNGNFYHPQTKFAKVMFSQVSVRPEEGGVQAQVRKGVYPSMH